MLTACKISINVRSIRFEPGLSDLLITNRSAISIIPAFEYTGRLYISEYALILVLIFGAIFLYYAFRLMVLKSDFAARMLLRVSIIYITCVQIIYVSDKILFQ